MRLALVILTLLGAGYLYFWVNAESREIGIDRYASNQADIFRDTALYKAAPTGELWGISRDFAFIQHTLKIAGQYKGPVDGERRNLIKAVDRFCSSELPVAEDKVHISKVDACGTTSSFWPDKRHVDRMVILLSSLE